MKNNMAVTLINRDTFEEHSFDRLREADEYLGRFVGYLMQRVRRKEIAYSATGEAFEVLFGEDNRSWVSGGRQPCETCKNFAFGCEWSERFEPVPDWVAIPTIISNKDHPVSSYHIISCPKFEEG